MLSNIKNIIFDLGGVVINLDRQRCVESFTNIGFPQAEALIDLYHPADFFQQMERGLITPHEVCEIIRRQAHNDNICDEDIMRAYSDFLVDVPLAKLRLIESLRERGFKIYALSNINAMVMPKVRELFAIDGKQFEDYFDKPYLSYQMHSLKPDPEIFQQLIADSQIIPHETLFIDDSKTNIEAGQKHGFAIYLAQAYEDYSHLFG